MSGEARLTPEWKPADWWEVETGTAGAGEMGRLLLEALEGRLGKERLRTEDIDGWDGALGKNGARGKA